MDIKPDIEGFMHDRFGLFLHWGCYSQLGKGEWNMFFERTPAEEYAKLAASFEPKSFDPRQWARTAKEAGMRYMVLTARHHDGFCLFDSKVSDFTSVKCSPGHRDYVAEYVEACREFGLKAGLYYSEMDWRFPGYFNYKTDKASAEAMRRQCHDQVLELMSSYGKIDILWYDGLWLAHDPGTDAVESPAFWRGKELNDRVRRLQPHIVINNRLGDPADFDTPEGAIRPPKDRTRPWECCKTMTHGWGYYGGPDVFARSSAGVIKDLIDCVSDNGNYLVNVGVTPDGRLPDSAVRTLHEVGAWLKINGESIYGAGSIDFQNDHYAWTRKENIYYFHMYSYPLDGRKVFPLMDAKIKNISIPGSDRKLKVEYASNHRIVISDLPSAPPLLPFLTLKIEFESPPMKISEDANNRAAWLVGMA
ncbi:MAG: Alpha-L-fucosidase [Lentisphaerae bacterium ADurb.Bin242]|nr:MAG: Alpha-L-fucosidase [Lentisphaerae bacterium ADurb.Bin242]